MNLIAFSRSRNCVNTQYAALSGAMDYSILNIKNSTVSYFVKFVKLLLLSVNFVYVNVLCYV